MTTNVDLIGASLAKPQVTWSKLKWPALKGNVFRLQVRIAKADKEGRYGKVRALQRLLTSSFSAKCLAIKRVTSSPGSKTPGVDGKTLRTDQQKGSAILALKRHGYKPQALRRIYIPKKSNLNEQRALSIPTIIDRGQQALHLLSLEPIVENRADPNAYGFRLKRSCHDAVEQCFNALSRKNSSQWILEGDIKSCFDRINHKYLLKEISMDKVILKKFLKSGYMEGNQLHHTNAGTPQGGTISAALVVIALSGLETNVRSTNDKIQKLEKINMIAYADDFIVTAASKELLENKVKPILAASLAKVGLELSEAKTRITHINDGFDFLGFNVRKYKNRKLLIKPAKAKIRSFLKKTKPSLGKALHCQQKN